MRIIQVLDESIFDEDEGWSFEGSKGGGWWLWTSTASQSMVQVGTHEIGHALGLGHSKVDGSIMWPYPGLGNPSLHSDDIAGIKTLYSCK